MKILELRFKNLNSLYGEWAIDFSHPEYQANGIFTLTGPTGAGKSTILDALCLALYGATPRLQKITKSKNDIMSRQTGECYAEVSFESQAGQFRCHWAQQRAYKKAEAELQTPRHEIAEAGTTEKKGKVLENQIRRVAAVIEEKTGMDFDRFTRSSLLAQGDFDKFLKANAEEKSTLLEQITGSSIYSAISRKTQEKQREEQEKLNLLETEASRILLLSPEQENAIMQNQEKRLKQEKEQASKREQVDQTIRWWQSIISLNEEISTLSEESQRLSVEQAQFKAAKEELRVALKAAELEGAYASLQAERQQQQHDQTALEKEKSRCKEHASTLHQKKQHWEQAKTCRVEAKSILEKAAPSFQKTRSLDQQREDKKTAIAYNENVCRKEKEQIDAQKKQEERKKERQYEAKEERKILQEYLRSHSQDHGLISSLAGIEEQFDQILAAQNNFSQQKRSKSNSQEILRIAKQKTENAKLQVQNQKKILEESRKLLSCSKKNQENLLKNRLLREYRAEKDALLREQAFVHTIGKLKAERARLQRGKPCPLCGAKKHPFAEENNLPQDKNEQEIRRLSNLIQDAEELESAIKKQEEREKTALQKWNEGIKKESKTQHKEEMALKNLQDLRENQQKESHIFSTLKESTLKKLAPWGLKEIKDPVDSDLDALRISLQKRRKRYQQQQEEKIRIDKAIVQLDGDVKKWEALGAQHQKILEDNQHLGEKLQQEYQAQTAERHDFFGSKDPDEEEARLKKEIKEAERVEQQAQTLYQESDQDWHSSQGQISLLQNRIQTRSSALLLQEENFAQERYCLGFLDEKQFQAATLSRQERQQRQEKAQILDQQENVLQVKKKDREDRLATEKAKNLSHTGIEEQKILRQELEESLQTIRQEKARDRHQLDENIRAKEQLKTKKSSLDAQQKECQRWKKLHALIGSADGKKYRNFAQGLTFELMISHANQQLEKISDRYLLLRNTTEALELDVMDTYQAGEIRSTKNLSGGESFLVSLALALGLSKMASAQVRVDSLFLDEGFGTLDEEALESTLTALSQLQESGKLIGIISHLSALKDRIRTQMIISPRSGGKSGIQGPGCRSILKKS